ncbi:hypothetical protein [Nocardia otitidiscaviarum]|uniref:hypothetical protein n=1 Tax=Nocardia otitidiscaviarum TaxID=1823 RepID=UPI0004A72601|nr:hypothetical protein [Nocardia otitidiscaviarum]
MSGTERMTLDEYMLVLKQRADEWTAAQTKPNLRFPPLLEWFIRDGDEDMVELPEQAPKPERERKARYYRPASYWRNEIQRLESLMAPLTEPLISDRAAAGGVALGRKRTARIQAREDGRLARYVALRKRWEHAQCMLRSAEAREKDVQRGAA